MLNQRLLTQKINCNIGDIIFNGKSQYIIFSLVPEKNKIMTYDLKDNEIHITPDYLEPKEILVSSDEK